jgi:hypothetical protein
MGIGDWGLLLAWGCLDACWMLAWGLGRVRRVAFKKGALGEDRIY